MEDKTRSAKARPVAVSRAEKSEAGRVRSRRIVVLGPALPVRWTAKREAIFLETLSQTANVREAARVGGMAGVRITRGRTQDNRAHLAPAFLEMMTDLHGGTRFGRQELDGELIEEIEGALWSRAAIDACWVREAPDLVRIVIGVDPPAGAGASSDACGIVVAGLCAEGRAYVLADASVQGASPEGWAAAVARAAETWRADRLIAEANNGGAMVESVLRAADEALPVTRVHAAHGKVARAEPVQALYARGRVFHVGAFAALEDEMCGLMVGGGYEGPGRSPDRADALVWAITELLLGKKVRPGVRSM